MENETVSKQDSNGSELLNRYFRVEKYNGGAELSEDKDLRVKNVISEDKSVYNCSELGNNFDLLLSLKDSRSHFVFVTNISVLGPYGCTAPICNRIIGNQKNNPS